MQPDIEIQKASLCKIYIALLTQNGTNPPIANILHNTLGEIDWTYEGVGYYRGASNNLFTVNKTFMTISNNLGATARGVAFGEDYLPSTIYIESAANGVDANDVLNNTPIEIRVYKY